MRVPHLRASVLLFAATLMAGCGADEPGGTVVTFPGSAVGDEATLLREQLRRFEQHNPGIRVLERRTPDAADQRRQLYVQWLNAGMADPDVLQLDVIWTPEFAAAGWLLPLDDFAADTGDLFAATLAANRWQDRLYAVPWFVDVGMLYWRTDLLDGPPATQRELVADARRALSLDQVQHGLVWQGARYEGLVTVFLEYLAANGGRILDDAGRVTVDAAPAVAALEQMTAALGDLGIVPREALTWHEEETRFAFQNGQALFMRNWPYAVPLLEDPERSRVAGRFAVTTMPPGPGGTAGAALGGSQLAINARSDQAQAAWAVIAFLTAPEQMRERARRLGQYPPRPSLYESGALEHMLPIAPQRARAIIERAVPRPATPLYAELSELLQLWLHRALSGQAEPADALARAADAMRRLLERAELAPGHGEPA
jgi:multiple sugar transport system substrate-binding protein